MKKVMINTSIVCAAIIILFGGTGIVFLKIMCSDKISTEMLVDIHNDPFKFPLWEMTKKDLQKEIPAMSGKNLGKLIQNMNQFARELSSNEIVKRISAYSSGDVITLGNEINRMDVWEVLIAKEISPRIKDLDAMDLHSLSKTPLRDLAIAEIRYRISNSTLDQKFLQMCMID